MPPQLTTCVNFHAVFLEPVDDGQRAKRRRLDQRAINFRRRRVKRLANEQTREPLVHEDGAVAVVPVQREQAAIRRASVSSPPRQVPRASPAFSPLRLDVIHPPVENIAHRRLAGFQSEITRAARCRPRCRTSPGTSASFSLFGAIAMSQVLVPMIFTSVPGATPEPTAPRCASNAPTATGMPAVNPVFFAHSRSIRRPPGQST